MDAESVFSEALQKDAPAERKRFLDEACADDTELRAEIEALLAAHADAGSFLQDPPNDIVATVGTDGRCNDEESGNDWRDLLGPSTSKEHIGTLGPYRIIEFIGRGGMGIVLRAFDPKLNRTVAIKLLSPQLAANAMAMRRFLREAQAAAAISHNHVVTIHAIDEQNRPPFIVMEFIDGPSLQQKIDDEGALEVKEILRIGAQTAAGLAAAHEQGLVHRDIKPANILLENGVERVKISDFGLARAVDDAEITGAGQIAGTPQYMSPEQAQGETVELRTDLFSLGSVMYAMCTGRPPFRADSAVGVLRRVCDDVPSPIRKVNTEIPSWMETIVNRLLAKMPADRFQSAAEVSDLLGQYLAHLQAPSAEPPAWPPANSVEQPAPSAPSRRRNFFVVLSLLLVAALAMIGGMINWGPNPPYPGAVQGPIGDDGVAHWYVVVTVPKGIGWEEAHIRAIDMGGHLVTITSKEEDEFVLRLLSDAQYWGLNPRGMRQGPWIGAIKLHGPREPDPEGGWRWVTGEPFFYSNWGGTQPNEREEAPMQNRIFHHLRGDDFLTAHWGDAGSGIRSIRSYVVEFDTYGVAKSHPKVDPYGVLTVKEDSRRIKLIVESGQFRLETEFESPATEFVKPGTYMWRLLDLSKGTEDQQLDAGSIVIKAGERVTFTVDGPRIDDQTR